MEFIRITDCGVEIFVRATPNAKNEIIDGFEIRDDGKAYLKIKTRAIADDGKANAAIIKIIAKALGLPKSDISINSGTKSRTKCLLVKTTTLDKSALIEKLLNPKSIK